MALLATTPGWHEEVDENGSMRDVKPFPSRPVVNAATFLQMLGGALAFAAATWQHAAAVSYGAASQLAASGHVSTDIGRTAAAFAWLGCSLLILVCVCSWLQCMFLDSLDRLTDDENRDSNSNAAIGVGDES